MDAQQFYEQLKTALVAWAESMPGVRVMIVVGSQARQVKPADEYSDLMVEEVTDYLLGLGDT